MHVIRFSLVVTGLCLTLAAAAATTTYGVNLNKGGETRVGFRAPLSTFGISQAPVTGWSNAVTGPVITWSADQTRLEHPVTFTLPAASLSTKLALRDHDILKLLDAQKHPTIRFTLKAINGLESAEVTAGKGDFAAVGDLTAHGVSHPVALACTFTRADKRLKIQGSAPVTWADFGMAAPSALAGSVKAANTFHLLLESTWELDTLPLHGK
jgi:polyisoprenoid-binding protein YceI